jgi:hypothetical protein
LRGRNRLWLWVGLWLGNRLGWDRWSWFRRLRRLRLGLRLPADVSERIDHGATSLSRILTLFPASSGFCLAGFRQRRRSRSRSSWAFDIFERPSIPRSFASS